MGFFNKFRLGLLTSIIPTAAVLYGVNQHRKGKALFDWPNKKSALERRQNVFLASNSLIYGLDKVSTNASNVPPIVVLAPIWLEKAHEFHHAHKWGQTPLGLPDYPRTLFHRLYPNYPNEEYVTWKQILEVRKLEMAELEKLHKQGRIILHDLRAADIKQFERGELLHFVHQDEHYTLFANGEALFKIPETQLGMVYNFLSLPQEVSPAQQQLGLNTRPHTELYYLSPKHVPTTVLIGGTGLSTVWIRKHFPNIENLFVLARSKDSKIPRIPSNEEVDYSSIYLITHEDILINKETGFFAIKNPRTGKLVTDIDPAKYFYSAIGYRPYTELTACIPNDHKLTLEDGNELVWTAPKNIPVGSLTQRLMTYYYLSELYEDYNYSYEMQYYTAGITPMQLQKRLHEKNIELHLDFFTHLSVAIKELDNPIDREHELDLYIKAFMLQNPSAYEQEQFKLTIKDMQQEIQNRQQFLQHQQEELASNVQQNLKK